MPITVLSVYVILKELRRCLGQFSEVTVKQSVRQVQKNKVHVVTEMIPDDCSGHHAPKGILSVLGVCLCNLVSSQCVLLHCDLNNHVVASAPL